MMSDSSAAKFRTDLSRFLNPRGVAVVGVSSDATRIGGQALRLLTDFGYPGRIYPVNPKYPDIKGLTCYPDLGSVPQPCDVALIALADPVLRAYAGGSFMTLADGFGANVKTRPDRGPVEQDMIAVIELEKLLAIERATVENGKRG